MAMTRPKQYKITKSKAYRVSLLALLTFSLFVVLHSQPVAQADTTCTETYSGWKDKNGDGIPEQYKLDVDCLANDVVPIWTEYCGVTDTFTVTISAKISFMTWLDGDQHLSVDQDDVWVDSAGKLVGTGRVHFVSTAHVAMPVVMNFKSNINCFNGGTDDTTSWHFGMNSNGHVVEKYYVKDSDHDEIANAADNCPTIANPDQLDTDADGIGNACDSTPTGDTDVDGVDNAADNCPTIANPDQLDTDADGIGNACDLDSVTAGT